MSVLTYKSVGNFATGNIAAVNGTINSIVSAYNGGTKTVKLKCIETSFNPGSISGINAMMSLYIRPGIATLGAFTADVQDFGTTPTNITAGKTFIQNITSSNALCKFCIFSSMSNQTKPWTDQNTLSNKIINNFPQDMLPTINPGESFLLQQDNGNINNLSISVLFTLCKNDGSLMMVGMEGGLNDAYIITATSGTCKIVSIAVQYTAAQGGFALPMKYDVYRSEQQFDGQLFGNTIAMDSTAPSSNFIFKKLGQANTPGTSAGILNTIILPNLLFSFSHVLRSWTSQSPGAVLNYHTSKIFQANDGNEIVLHPGQGITITGTAGLNDIAVPVSFDISFVWTETDTTKPYAFAYIN